MAAQVIDEWWNTQPIQMLMNVLNAPDDSARFVGGCVRNTILRIPITDVDIGTKHHPQQTINLLQEAGIKYKCMGLSHGTVTAFLDEQKFEITTLRRDVTTDGRHAEVEYTNSWTEDAMRRDFTVNALFMDASGRIFDPLNYRHDILDGHIRFVGCPALRIQEDSLRILRFFRFHAYYGRGEIDPQGLKACQLNAEKLKNLSGERIREELFKIMSAPGAGYVTEQMLICSVLKNIFSGSVQLEAFKRLISLGGYDHDPICQMVVLLGASADELISRLSLSNKMSKRLVFLAQTNVEADSDPRLLKELMYRYGAQRFLDLITVKFALDLGYEEAYDNCLEIIKVWKEPKFPLKGSDILALGIKPGAEVGRILTATEDWWISTGFSASYENCIKWVRSKDNQGLGLLKDE